MRKKVKALVLLSGGLDSMLAAKILMEQGIEVTGISFISSFFGAEKAEKAVRQLGIKLKKIDFKKEHLEMECLRKNIQQKIKALIEQTDRMLLDKGRDDERYQFIRGRILGLSEILDLL